MATLCSCWAFGSHSHIAPRTVCAVPCVCLNVQFSAAKTSYNAATCHYHEIHRHSTHMDEDALEDHFVSDWQKLTHQLHRNGYQSGLNSEDAGDLTDGRAYKETLVKTFSVAQRLGSLNGRVQFSILLANQCGFNAEQTAKLQEIASEIKLLLNETRLENEISAKEELNDAAFGSRKESELAELVFSKLRQIEQRFEKIRDGSFTLSSNGVELQANSSLSVRQQLSDW